MKVTKHTTEFQIAFDYNFSAFTFRSGKFKIHKFEQKGHIKRCKYVCRVDIKQSFYHKHKNVLQGALKAEYFFE